ncbi:MAG: hypothetical protein ABSE73_10400, partial [Planctomycetota bacterium]
MPLIPDPVYLNIVTTQPGGEGQIVRLLAEREAPLTPPSPARGEGTAPLTLPSPARGEGTAPLTLPSPARGEGTAPLTL